MKGVVEAGSCRKVVWASECSGAGGGCRDCWRGKSGREKRYRLEEEGGRDLEGGELLFGFFE